MVFSGGEAARYFCKTIDKTKEKEYTLSEEFFMGRVMALDIGDKRIGIALSDPMKIIASPFDTLKRVEIKGDINKIVKIIEENDVETVVCGLPKKLDNTDSLQTVKAREFADTLREKTAAKVVMTDERLTTVSAERVLLEADVSRGKRREVIDKLAAAVILQSYLESV